MKLRLWYVLMVSLLVAGCSRSGPEKTAAAASRAPAAPISVRVAPAEARRIQKTVAVTGSLQPDETVTVSAEVPGRVLEVRADFGQRVRKGEVIAELDKREISFQLERARASLAQALARIGLDPTQVETQPETTPAIRQAQAQMEEARFKYENAARLVKTGDISQERYIELEKIYFARRAAYEAARDELRTALANIQALRAEMKLAEKRLSDTTVRAPFDGSVTVRHVSPGQYIKENVPIVTLVKAHPLRLRVEIPEPASAEVRVGTTLTFTTEAAPNRQFQAVVRELNPALDPRSRSLTAEARLAQADPVLRPGMFVQVRLVVARDASVVVVPKQAIYQLAGLSKVFVVRGGRVIENKIVPGGELGGWVEVPAQKIRPGDEVAVSNLAALTDGLAVKAERGGGS